MLRRPLYTFARWLERKTALRRLVGRFEGENVVWEHDGYFVIPPPEDSGAIYIEPLRWRS